MASYDKVWPFFAYDWVLKFRILMYNMTCHVLGLPLRTIIVTYHLQKSIVCFIRLGSGEKVHNKLGQYIPPTLTGTKKYWAKEYLDLVAFCERCGVPDFFITNSK